MYLSAVTFCSAIISLSLKNDSTKLAYGTTASSSVFEVSYLNNGTNHQANYIVPGDVILVEFLSPHSLSEGEELKLTIIPKSGNIRTISTYMPDIMVTKQVSIYP